MVVTQAHSEVGYSPFLCIIIIILLIGYIPASLPGPGDEASPPAHSQYNTYAQEKMEEPIDESSYFKFLRDHRLASTHAISLLILCTNR